MQRLALESKLGGDEAPGEEHTSGEGAKAMEAVSTQIETARLLLAQTATSIVTVLHPVTYSTGLAYVDPLIETWAQVRVSMGGISAALLGARAAIIPHLPPMVYAIHVAYNGPS